MSLFHRQDRCFHNRWFVNFMARRFSKRLQLDKEQQQQLLQLQTTMQSICADLQSSRISVFHDAVLLLNDEKLDREAALKMLQSPKVMLEKRLADMVNGFGDLFDNFNTEQRTQLLQLWQSKHHSL